MSFLYTAIPFLFILGLLVFVHEFGHYWAAKRAGMKVEAFAIGMGPAIWSTTRKTTLGAPMQYETDDIRLPQEYETTYSLCAIPIGGYVKIAGMDPNEDPDQPGGFNTKPWGWRFLTLIAGCVMNFVLAAFLFCIVGTFIGLPKDGQSTNRIYDVLPQMPAEKANLQPGDRIVGVGGQSMSSTAEIKKRIESSPGKPLQLMVVRGNQNLNVSLTPRLDTSEGKPAGKIGVVFTTVYERVSPLVAIESGLERTWEQTYMMVEGLKLMVTGKIKLKDSVGGPVAIFRQTGHEAQKGWDSFLLFAAVLSINLGVLNLLPIPALDGGRLLFLLIEAARFGRRVDPQKEAYVHMVGMVLLLLLILVITYHDIVNIVMKKA